MCEKCSDCLCGWLTKQESKLIRQYIDKGDRSDCATMVVKLRLLTDSSGLRLVSDNDIARFIQYYKASELDLANMKEKHKVSFFWAKAASSLITLIDDPGWTDMNAAGVSIASQWDIDKAIYIYEPILQNIWWTYNRMEFLTSPSTQKKYENELEALELKGNGPRKCTCGTKTSFLEDFLDNNPQVMAAGINLNFLNAKSANPPGDPLVLDLDGDGFDTVADSAGITFNHDGDGTKHGTGWVGADDGLLVYDRNGNGNIDNGGELFGNYTVKYDGTGLAANAPDHRPASSALA